jgi:hypothetical protein
MNILSGNKFPTLENGARDLAVQAQIYDDYKDLLGEDGNIPHFPNPSYFLTYCREHWKKMSEKQEKRDEELEQTMLLAAIDTKTKGMEYHQKVKGEFEKLGQTFSTRNELELIVSEVNKKLVETHDAFRAGKTFADLKKELEQLLA